MCSILDIFPPDAMRNLPTSDDDKYHGSYNNKVFIGFVLFIVCSYVYLDLGLFRRIGSGAFVADFQSNLVL